MEKLKKILDRIFIEGLSAMAQGLFATLIIGTIIQQIGDACWRPGGGDDLCDRQGGGLSYRSRDRRGR